ncbi:MAG TPA: hypothetical protein VLD67_15615 [Vicinamibacterales bacterium]|nr:hypothetical protein [Vicinamibacterales bacterium]
MNHHADKLVHATDSEGLDPMFGGMVLETHGCPGCGHIESRPAPRVS